MTTPNTLPATGGVSDADELDSLVRMAGTLAIMHAEYMGKAMPDDVYQRFTTLRDERIPELRAKLKTALAQSRQPSAQGGDAEPTAWLIEYDMTYGERRRHVELHNSVGDYRDQFSNVTSEPLYKHPPAGGGKEALSDAEGENHAN